MFFGAHELVTGGLHLAFDRGSADGCRAIQIFTKPSSMWREPELSDAAIAEFRSRRAAHGNPPVLAHTSYLINLATDEPDILAKSKDALVCEVMRSSALGVSYCVLHPGAHMGAGDDEGITRVVRALDEVHARTRGASARILIENTAGQGSCVGHKLEHVARILNETKEGERLGVCFDTQHAFAAGYDLSSASGYAKTWETIDRLFGAHRVLAFHLNDSKKGLGARVDRHEHIGEGVLGLALFWRLANDPRFVEIPAVLETEPRTDDAGPYKEEVALLRSLVGAPEPKPKVVEFRLEIQDDTAKKPRRRS
jgi:deoxyribonuclease-4